MAQRPVLTKLILAGDRREQWERLTEVVPDRSELDDSFEQWERQAFRAIRMLRAQGLHPVPVQVDVDELVDWCRERGLVPDAGSRADYVSHLLTSRSRPADG